MTTETLMTPPAENSQDAAVASQPATEQAAATEAVAETVAPEQAPDSQAADTDSAKPDGAPESYDFKPPEGQQFDQQVLQSFAEVARELNLTQDAAQRVLDTVGPVMQARQAEQLEAIRTSWADAAKADKEFGGDKLSENLAYAKQALDAYGSPELRQLLNETGLGNHPEIIRMMVKAGKASAEDSLVTGRKVQAGETTMAKRMFPNLN